MKTSRGQDSEEVRALVYESVSDVIFRLAVEGDRFRFIEINPMFTRATGLSEADVVGKLVDEVIPEPSLSLVLQKYRHAIAERRTVRWDEVTDYPTGRKFGEVSVTPLVLADGACVELVGTVRDVSETRRARALLAAERRVLELIASGSELGATLDALVRAIEELAPPAIASVVLLSPDGRRLAAGAAPSLPQAYNQALVGLAVGPSAGSCGSAVALRKPIVTEDIETDPRWEQHRELVRPYGLRACWSTPILSSGDRVLGSFALYYREPRVPTAEDRDLIDRATHIARIAIERSELDEQMRALTARIEAAREEERTGIAREIHDQLGQTLTVLKMDLAWIARRASAPEGIATDTLLAKLAELSGMTDEIVQQVRRISAELRPGVLDDLGLDAALSWQAQEFEKRTGVICAVVTSLDGARIPREVSTTVFRVLEEALTNVARHANAKRVDVNLSADEATLILRVRDDGAGIRPERIHDPHSLGLLGIRERARRLGGFASFEAAKPTGTSLTVTLPLRGSTA